jgi:hypothetical protein
MSNTFPWSIFAMPPLCSIFSFVLLNAGLIGSSRLTMLAELVPRSLDLVHRGKRTGGGWSLSADTCPYGTSKCDIGSWCCPSSFICMDSGDAIAEVCCPGGWLVFLAPPPHPRLLEAHNLPKIYETTNFLVEGFRN